MIDFSKLSKDQLARICGEAVSELCNYTTGECGDKTEAYHTLRDIEAIIAEPPTKTDREVVEEWLAECSGTIEIDYSYGATGESLVTIYLEQPEIDGQEGVDGLAGGYSLDEAYAKAAEWVRTQQ